MTIADPQGSPASLAKVQQVLDVIEAAEISPEDALQIALALVSFVEEFHLEALEELLQADQPEVMSVAVWAADAARLENVRLQLSEVLGEDDEELEEGDASGDDDADF